MSRPLTVLAAIWLATAASAQTITQADLLMRLVELDRLTTPPPAGLRTGLFSSYDRKQAEIADGRYVNWASNDDSGHFLESHDDWQLAARIDGPGVLTRIWCDQPRGKLRIVLDGQPVIEATLADFFSGAVEPFGEPLTYQLGEAGGLVSYFPIGFARSCRVWMQGFTGEYQIDYAAFAPSVRVQTFTTELDERAAEALERVVRMFKHGLDRRLILGPRGTSPQGTWSELKPGDKLTWTIDRPGTIRSFQVALTDRAEPRAVYALHKCVLRIWWDDSPVPDVELPLPAFFGTGFGRNLYNSLPMGTNLGTTMPGQYATEGWFMYNYYPMPFARSARIEIANENERGVKLGLMLVLRVDLKPPPRQALRFRAHMWVQDPCKVFDIPVLQSTGQGYLVGLTLNVDCPRPQWWGEGDHKIWLGDEAFPSIVGTSTQGLFGNVRGLIPAQRALHGATLVNRVGKNSLYRWFVPDAVAFHDGIAVALENWQYNKARDVYYAVAAFWYAQPNAQTSYEPLSRKKLEVPGLRIPGAVEIEGHVTSSDWGSVYRQKYARGVELSGRAAARIKAGKQVEIELLCSRPGRYLLKLRTLPGRSFGTIVVRTADGHEVGTVQYARRRDAVYRVGELDITEPVTVLTVECSRTTILDCWILEPLDKRDR